MIITQPKNGYRYNSDTMFLYDFIREGGARGEVLDAGCGSGVLGLLLKRDFPKISLSLLDILEANVNLAAANAMQNAKNMLEKKSLDAVCLNVLGGDINFGSDSTQITFITHRDAQNIALTSKEDAARQIVNLASKL